MQERPEAAEIWLPRTMLSISWLYRMHNETVLRKADTRRELMTMINARQTRFLGHFNRMDKIEHSAMTGKLQGNKR